MIVFHNGVSLLDFSSKPFPDIFFLIIILFSLWDGYVITSPSARKWPRPTAFPQSDHERDECILFFFFFYSIIFLWWMFDALNTRSRLKVTATDPQLYLTHLGLCHAEGYRWLFLLLHFVCPCVKQRPWWGYKTPRLGDFFLTVNCPTSFAWGGRERDSLVEDEGSNVEGNEVSEVSGVNWAGKRRKKKKRNPLQRNCWCRLIPAGAVTVRTHGNAHASCWWLVVETHPADLKSFEMCFMIFFFCTQCDELFCRNEVWISLKGTPSKCCLIPVNGGLFLRRDVLNFSFSFLCVKSVN